MTLKIAIDRVGDVLQGLQALERERVLVGVPADETERKPEDGALPPIGNAALLYIHEHGAPEANIPARPTLSPGIRDVKDYVADQYRLAAEDAMAGHTDRVNRRLHAIGLKAQTAIKRRFVDGPFVPLSDATLANRKARGVTRTKPMIDTGQLRNSVNYVIRRRG